MPGSSPLPKAYTAGAKKSAGRRTDGCPLRVQCPGSFPSLVAPADLALHRFSNSRMTSMLRRFKSRPIESVTRSLPIGADHLDEGQLSRIGPLPLADDGHRAGDVVVPGCPCQGITGEHGQGIVVKHGPHPRTNRPGHPDYTRSRAPLPSLPAGGGRTRLHHRRSIR